MTARKPTKIPRPPQCLLLAIIMMLSVPVLVHSLPLPRAQQEKLLPPAEYDHDYDGELLLVRMAAEDISIVCKRALAPGQTLTLGCSQSIGRSCRVMIAKDEELKQHGLDYDIVYRHEVGHCNGWKHAD
jgi:hypothetical protein